MPNLRPLGLCLLAAALMPALPADAQDQPEAPVNQVYACVPEDKDEVRFVTKAEACQNDETPVRWKAQGPAGPAGLPGPRYAVVDANGGLIGEAFYVHPVFADVRVIHVDENGEEHGYALRFSRRGVTLTGADPGALYHDDPACAEPVEYLQSGVAERFFSPAFSRQVVVVKFPADGGTPGLVRITGAAEERDVFAGQEGQCYARRDKVLAIEVLIDNLRSRFPGPYQIQAE